MCISGTAETTIPASIEQNASESEAERLLTLIPQLSPSPECAKRIKPFLCLHIFGLCDGSSRSLHTVVREDCLEMREMVCSREWKIAVNVLGAGILPMCEDLPDTTEDCIGNY